MKHDGDSEASGQGHEDAARALTARQRAQALIDNKGAIDVEDLKRLAESHSSLIFCGMFRSPFLVGSSIQKGSLLESRMRANETMTFEPSVDEDGQSLASMIFPLMHKFGGSAVHGKFRIGRTTVNDMVMNDFVISREHAVLEMSDGEFGIVDLDSRNGTWVDAQSVHPHRVHPVSLGANISFGRYEFTLMGAERLREQLLET